VFFGWVLMGMLAAGLIAVGLLSEHQRKPRPDGNTPPAPVQHAAGSQQSPSQIGEPERIPADSRLRLNFRFKLDYLFFLLALIIYLLTRLVALDQYPIFFFSDEAINTILAEDFLRDGLHDYDGQLLPTFFKNYDRYNLSTSVYLQVLPSLLFPRDVVITRAVAALATLLAAVSVSLILKQVFNSPAWWSGVLFLSITPAWFLHSRTAFETALMTSFYAGFLYCYLRYRQGRRAYLYGAILLAALAFYTYSPARVIIPLTAGLFLLVDAGYHWQHRRALLWGLVLSVVCMLPYLRFLLIYPEANYLQLYQQASYWVQPGSSFEKIGRFLVEYLRGLNPIYWFSPGEQDLARHQFDGYGHILLLAAPFLAVGLIQAIRRFRQPAYRLLLLSMLVIPCGAAVIEVGITRLLALVIPFSIFAGLGLAALLGWLEGKGLRYRTAAGISFLVLTALNIWMLAEALRSGPTWDTQYGLGGMQWGASQVFGKINQRLETDPGAHIVLSPTWANGTDTLARFFLKQDPPPVELSSIDRFLNEQVPDIQDRLFVLPEYEFAQANESNKLVAPLIEDILPYPNGQPGFYFVRLAYVPDVKQIFAAEMEARRHPETSTVLIDGQQVLVRHSRLDIGEIAMAFDGDLLSLCRTLVDNPAEIRLSFPEPREIQGLGLVIGSTRVEVNTTIRQPGGELVQHRFFITGNVNQPSGEFFFPQPLITEVLTISIRDTQQGDPGNVHFWEINLK
jgi:hypothetical protein